MDKEGIKASVGLGFSLELFKKYRGTGILQAKVRRFPGIQGPGVVSLFLVDGRVVSCYVEDKNGQHSPISADVLIRFDNEKGPYEWTFRSSSPKSASTSVTPPPVTPAPITPVPITPPPIPAVQPQTRNTGPLPAQMLNATVSKIVSSLPSERLLGWTIQQRRMYLLVWKEIDGKKTIYEIKATLAMTLPETTIDEILQTLLKLQLIMISR